MARLDFRFWRSRQPKPDAWTQAQSAFAARIEAARKAHKPIRHIEAERREMVHAALRGAK